MNTLTSSTSHIAVEGFVNVNTDTNNNPNTNPNVLNSNSEISCQTELGPAPGQELEICEKRKASIVKFDDNLETPVMAVHDPLPNTVKPIRSCLRVEKLSRRLSGDSVGDEEPGFEEEDEDGCSSQSVEITNYEGLWAKRKLRIDKLSDSFKLNKITCEFSANTNNNDENGNDVNLVDQQRQQFCSMEGLEGEHVGNNFAGAKVNNKKRSRVRMYLE
eukprot:TRINITY_DN2225_c0_g1_i3.p3 TRINITY_DN2225_c0_g1~~TRINITY_DN2225_c0_g1_i3.p3  ORF type:complete len:217 (-),score=28.66 TRINITY_DN2225_c0_g1_i3:2284-2934(-)